jgi:hypothetical protein
MRAFGFQMDEILKKDKNSADGFSGAIVSVGNAVSALGGGADAFRRITYALGQMKQAGRVYQNDMMQLANAGIGGYRYIAQSLMKEISTNADGTAKKMTGSQQALYNKLQSNAIETVRRLTTNGQISGEAAARAILEGLNRDFGGGMKRLSMTFAGAFSTVADMSQSLMATAFKPFYNDIRDITYSLSLFLQDPKVMARAQEFGKVIAAVSHELKGAIRTISQIVSASFNDLQNAMKSVSDQTNKVGDGFRMTFGGFANGIAAIGQLLRNDFVRELVYAGVVAKTVFAFAEKNPFLTEIMLVITAIGLLKQAYDENLLGFRDSFNDLANALQPLIATVRDDLMPVLAGIGMLFSQTIFAVVLQGFRLVEPAIAVFTDALTIALKLIKAFEAPIKAIATLIAVQFVGKWLLAGRTVTMVGEDAKVSMGPIMRLSTSLANIMGQFDAIVQKTRALALTKKSGQTLLSMNPDGSYSSIPTNQTKIDYSGSKPGANTMLGGAGFIAGLGSTMSKAGMGLMGIGTIGSLAGVSDEITGLMNNIGIAAFSLSQIGTMMPAGSLDALKRGFGMLFDSIKSMVMLDMASLAANLGKFKTAIMEFTVVEAATTALTKFKNTLLELPVIGAALSFLGGKIGFIKGSIGELAAALAEVAGPIAVLLGVIATALGLSELAKNSSRSAVRNETDYHHITNLNGQTMTDDEVKKIEYINRMLMNGWYTVQQLKETQGITDKDLELYKKYIDLTRTQFTDQEKAQAAVNFREGERQSWIDSHNAGIAQSNSLLTQTSREYQLLVNSQNQANNAQATYNYLLGVAKQQLSEATTLVEQLAKGVLEDILNPKSRTDPYSGIEKLGMTYEQVLATEQEMGFAQFTNAEGIVRNFDEYKDVLNSILPLSDKDMVNGQISLKAVNERLKIEQERRKEQELITKAAEAEYNIGLANLQQYDQSIDPLQRAVNLHKAQRQYTKDINDLKIEGLNLVVSEATSSDAWSAATAATQQRLQEYKQGQQLILDQMTAMFNKYNQDIANILANPNLSASQRKNAIEERTKQLNTDLEKNFGITQTMMQTKLTSLNAAINATMQAVGYPSLPHITWGNDLAKALDKGGYSALTSYLAKKAIEVANLQSQVLAAASGDQLVKGFVVKNRDALKATFQARMNQAGKNGKRALLTDEWLHLSRDISNFGKLTNFEELLTQANKIDKSLSTFGLAKGGFARSGSPYLVGEQGPEIFMPRTSGMVINSNISSRLASMLSGNGGGGANVTININNPVVRNDADIRKLADQISRAQASQFRTQGGRLS